MGHGFHQLPHAVSIQQIKRGSSFQLKRVTEGMFAKEKNKQWFSLAWDLHREERAS
jgi:hypothetical protein